MRIPTDREPTHPGEMLRDEFLRPRWVSASGNWQKRFMFHISVSTSWSTKTGCHAEHGVKIGEVFQYLRRLLAQPAIPLGFYWAQQSEMDDIESISGFSQVKELA